DRSATQTGARAGNPRSHYDEAVVDPEAEVDRVSADLSEDDLEAAVGRCRVVRLGVETAKERGVHAAGVEVDDGLGEPEPGVVVGGDSGEAAAVADAVDAVEAAALADDPGLLAAAPVDALPALAEAGDATAARARPVDAGAGLARPGGAGAGLARPVDAAA